MNLEGTKQLIATVCIGDGTGLNSGHVYRLDYGRQYGPDNRLVGFVAPERAKKRSSQGKLAISPSSGMCPQCYASALDLSSLEDLLKTEPEHAHSIELYKRYLELKGGKHASA